MLTLQDVRDATSQAEKRFADHVTGNFTIDLSVGAVIIAVIIVKDRHDDEIWNYNIPLTYEMSSSGIAALALWWKGVHPDTGIVLEPLLKYDRWIINIQWRTADDRLFNMHVAVVKQNV